MAYLSDIDLATLHKTRLEEKFNYRLSWLTNQKSRISALIIGGAAGNKKPYNVHERNGHAGESLAKKVVKNAATQKQTTRQHCDSHEEIHVKEIEAREFEARHKRMDFDDLSDDGYFSSDTRRRRSGTWP